MPSTPSTKTGTAVAERKPPPVIAMLDSRMRDFAAVLPKHMHSDRFVRTIKTAINLNPQLLECPPMVTRPGLNGESLCRRPQFVR